jgi:hypothetical protein
MLPACSSFIPEKHQEVILNKDKNPIDRVEKNSAVNEDR